MIDSQIREAQIQMVTKESELWYSKLWCFSLACQVAMWDLPSAGLFCH